ncbi:g10640 [Coccomyxa elongata]
MHAASSKLGCSLINAGLPRSVSGARRQHPPRREAVTATAPTVERSGSEQKLSSRIPSQFETIQIAGITMTTPSHNRPMPDLSTIKGVLFDVDGTLTDSDPLHFKAFQDILTQYNYKGYNNGEPISREFFDEHISGGHNILLSKFLWPDRDQEWRDNFSDEKEALFRKYADSVLERVPGLTEFIAWIDERGLKKAAVTNAPRENARVMLAALGLGEYFDIVVLGEESARPKPHPDPYQDALKALGLQPHEAIICEDSPSGTAAGVAAEVPVVGILTSQAKERMLKAGVSLTVTDYHQLVERAKADVAKHQNGAIPNGHT